MRVIYPVYIDLGMCGGVEVYARNLVRAIQDIDNKNEYRLLCSVLNEEAFPVVNPNFKKIVQGKSKTIEKAKRKVLFVAGKIYEFIDNKIILSDFKRVLKHLIFGKLKEAKTTPSKTGGPYDLEVIHYMFTTFPYHQDFDAPVVLTIVDIQQEYFPEFFTKRVLEARIRDYRSSAEKADHIIAISAFTKKTIIEQYNIPEGKITVVHLGYDTGTYKKLGKEAVEEFRAKYKLPGKFLFYPAASWPHKNHLTLLKAFGLLKERYGFEGKLVLTGAKKESHTKIEEEAKRLGLEREVLYLGYLPYPELPLLYNAAELLVFPSLFEGFGMPVVEAFATGLPVVCSNTTSLPEIGGDAAAYFDPTNPEDIAETILKVWNDEQLRAHFIRKGFERAQMFTWKRTAEETLMVYEKVSANFQYSKKEVV